MLYALAPLAVGVVSRLNGVAVDSVQRALDTGAIYLLVPCLFAVLVLGLTQMPWAGWIAFGLEAFLLGMLALADAVLEHRLSTRAVIVVVMLGYALVRQRAWTQSRRLTSPASAAG